MNDAWRLDDYQQMLEAELAAALEKQGNSDLDTNELVERTVRQLVPQVADLLGATLAKRSKGMLREHRTLRRGFLRRNFKRWRQGFDLLERLIVISQETGGAINDALRAKAAEENDALFEAVITSHARAVQVSREILTLMLAGFPDGAMGRWRTLHEIAVVSMFLSHAGRQTAERFILHNHVTSYKRAKNYMEHHERANLEPIEPEVMAQLKVAHDEVLLLDKRLQSDYGWAAEPLGKERPTFADLEAATDLDHWRPRYKWATINTHGAYRTMGTTLAACESEQPALLVGESNSGMTDPAHMTAISLNLATMPAIMLEPNLDRLAAATIMDRLSEEIGDTFWRLDRETFARSRRRKWWQVFRLQS
jgi:hypothetical protein